MSLTWHSLSQRGVKIENQDAWAVPAEYHDTVAHGHCVALADGVSNSVLAAQIAQLTVQVVDHYYALAPEHAPDDALDRALHAIWEDYHQRAAASEDWAYSACSLTVVHVQDSTIRLRHMGDTTCDLLLPNRAAQRLTDTHAEHDGTLLRTFGGLMEPDYQHLTRQLPAGARILLSSDGVTAYFPPHQLNRLAALCRWRPTLFLAQAAGIARTRGSTDDATLILGVPNT